MRISTFLFCLLIAASASARTYRERVELYLEKSGLDGSSALPLMLSGDIVVRQPPGGPPRIARWSDRVGAPAPASGVLEAYLDADFEAEAAAEDAAYQASKSPSLKQAENKLIKFLRDEGAIAADAVLATADEIDAMFANWEATLNDAQLEKKSTKYDRLLRAVERRGGTELDARYH